MFPFVTQRIPVHTVYNSCILYIYFSWSHSPIIIHMGFDFCMNFYTPIQLILIQFGRKPCEGAEL
jgi:hypothetical protein